MMYTYIMTEMLTFSDLLPQKSQNLNLESIDTSDRASSDNECPTLSADSGTMQHALSDMGIVSNRTINGQCSV